MGVGKGSAGERDDGNTGGSEPAFEIVVLGSGGGPLETDCSGYLVKPYLAQWEDGIVALEGGSGLGALSSLMEVRASDIFPGVTFPKNYDTPILKAAYIFSFLTCYLITHAHLDHTLSLIMLSGSVPPRPSIVEHAQPPITSVTPATGKAGKAHTESTPERNAQQARVPVYGTKETLQRLSIAYGGGLWPELGQWAPDSEPSEGAEPAGARRKRRKVGNHQPSQTHGYGVVLSPMAPSEVHRPLHPALPITTLTYPVAHGCTSQGMYESSAVFVRYDPAALEGEIGTDFGKGDGYREFLFFGDVESDWRKKGEEDVNKANQEGAARMNTKIWEEAARGWDKGRLAGIFIECSYDSDRAASVMFGHISPPGLYHELERLASLVQSKDSRPLSGLKVFVTHIKEALVPHPSGRSARDRIISELNALEKERKLGVVFVGIQRGDRILL